MTDFLQDILENNNYELYHHGILGQKWGVRRYQNPDGSLTPRGKKRLYEKDGQLNKRGKKLYVGKYGALTDAAKERYYPDADAMKKPYKELETATKNLIKSAENGFYKKRDEVSKLYDKADTVLDRGIDRDNVDWDKVHSIEADAKTKEAALKKEIGTTNDLYDRQAVYDWLKKNDSPAVTAYINARNEFGNKMLQSYNKTGAKDISPDLESYISRFEESFYDRGHNTNDVWNMFDRNDKYRDER